MITPNDHRAFKAAGHWYIISPEGAIDADQLRRAEEIAKFVKNGSLDVTGVSKFLAGQPRVEWFEKMASEHPGGKSGFLANSIKHYGNSVGQAMSLHECNARPMGEVATQAMQLLDVLSSDELAAKVDVRLQGQAMAHEISMGEALLEIVYGRGVEMARYEARGEEDDGDDNLSYSVSVSAIQTIGRDFALAMQRMAAARGIVPLPGSFR